MFMREEKYEMKLLIDTVDFTFSLSLVVVINRSTVNYSLSFFLSFFQVYVRKGSHLTVSLERRLNPSGARGTLKREDK